MLGHRYGCVHRVTSQHLDGNASAGAVPEGLADVGSQRIGDSNERHQGHVVFGLLASHARHLTMR
jgi:hypothetical protein